MGDRLPSGGESHIYAAAESVADRSESSRATRRSSAAVESQRQRAAMQTGVMQATQQFWTPSWYCSQLLLPYAAAAERAAAPSPPSHTVEQQLQQKRSSNFTIDAILGTGCSRDARSANRQLAAHPYFPVFGDLYDDQQRREHQRLPYYRCQNAPKGKVGLAKGGDRCKRIRTIFTTEQLNRLEEEFAKQQYMVGSERFYLASKLRLSEAQVKVWFQNRRIKWRKQTLDRSSPAHSDSEAAYSGSEADDTCSDSGSDSCSGAEGCL